MMLRRSEVADDLLTGEVAAHFIIFNELVAHVTVAPLQALWMKIDDHSGNVNT